MRIYFNKVKEDWIVDRYINEWNEYNYKSVRSSFISDTLIWIIAPWTWRNVSKRNLKKQKVICTIHHIDEDKFNDIEKEEFLEVTRSGTLGITKGNESLATNDQTKISYD